MHVTPKRIAFAAVAAVLLAAVLFWLYLLSWVLVLGILFNKLWRDTRDMKARKENE